jgi:uncharacterized membrane protein YgcG
MVFKNLFSLCFFLSFFVCSTAQESERIQSFDVEIVLLEDRSIQVEENIKVTALGSKIKRGITRSLPTYRRIDGQKFNTKYKNIQILRDGQEENYTEKKVNGELIYYIGNKNIFLDPGTYVYTIRYEVPNQIIVGSEGVQLRWNAIGNDVIFESDKASVTIKADAKIGLADAKMYVGRYGAGEDQNRVRKTQSENEIFFEILNGLNAKEAATVEINLDPGSVKKPTFFEQKSSLLTLALGGLAMLFYFVITWMKYGIDPKPDPSALLYDIPQNLSPAALNYIGKERYHARALTSSFIALATKGYVKIVKEGESGFFSSEVYVIHKLREASNDLTAEQVSLMQNLFAKSTSIYLDGNYNPIVNKARNAHRSSVEVQHRDFVKEGSNLNFIFYPILILVFVLVASSILANTIEINSYPHFSNLAWFLPLSIISLIIYRYLIIQPTVEKLNLQEEIRAFKQYISMSIAEVTQLDDPPVRDIEHFEYLLPYAYALGVESDWSNSFSTLLTQSNYAPTWSGGYYYPVGIHSGFSRGLSSTATKPQPANSGGGGGGGFSGGGGGGGGVGGW